MSNGRERLTNAVRARFAGREALSATESFFHFAADSRLSDEQITDALHALDDVFEIPAGWLRPNDDLALFLEPPEMSFGERLVYEVRFGDRQLKLHELIEERLAANGTKKLWPRITTIGDFVRAWNGRPLGPP